MKKLLIFMTLLITTSMIPSVCGEPDLVLTVEPEPEYNQMWAFETYWVNVTLTGLNVTEYSEYDLTGRVIADGIVRWRGTGQYHHGESVSSYSYKLENDTLTLSAIIDDPSFIFNLTLSRDAYLYGVWPYENVEIILNFNIFLEIENDDSLEFGPLIESISLNFLLLDDDKAEYLEDLFLEMDEEVQTMTGALRLNDFNRTKYESIVSAMNASIISGNYIEAQDQWERWDNRERLRMLSSFSEHVYAQTENLEALESVEMELERVQVEFDLIEDRYLALLTNNRDTNAELEAMKQSLTTAITVIFLSAIVFFFLGRRSNITGED
jgi:hypothetical protein